MCTQKNVERLLSTPHFLSFSLFTFHFSPPLPPGRGRGWALERAVAHAARSGDSGQCCRECCNGDAHNDLPQTFLFCHNFLNLQFDNLLFTIYLQFYNLFLISHFSFNLCVFVSLCSKLKTSQPWKKKPGKPSFRSSSPYCQPSSAHQPSRAAWIRN